MSIVASHFILYVADQLASTAFYSKVFDLQPRLDVPGMTEFDLGGGAVLGLMPRSGARRLLQADGENNSFPGGEIYLIVDTPAEYHGRSLEAGAREISPLQPRDWGHTAAYSYDLDGYVLAFAAPQP